MVQATAASAQAAELESASGMTGAPQQHVDLSAGAAAVLVKGEAQGAMEQIKQQLAAHSGPTGSLLGTGVQKEDRSDQAGTEAVTGEDAEPAQGPQEQGGPDRYKLSQRLAVKLRCEWGRLSGANDYPQPEQWEDVLGNVLSGDMSEEQMKAELRLKLKPQPGVPEHPITSYFDSIVPWLHEDIKHQQAIPETRQRMIAEGIALLGEAAVIRRPARVASDTPNAQAQIATGASGGGAPAQSGKQDDARRRTS